MSDVSTTRPTFLTFAPMVDSETARLLLAYYGIAYDERDHLIGWVQVLARLHSRSWFVPLLYGKDVNLTGPSAITAHFDPALPLQDPAWCMDP